MSTDPIGDAVGETPTTELVSGAVGGRCANCQAPLASDQRYCLSCGERRGKPRFPVMPTTASQTVVTPEPERAVRHPRSSGAATLVAGIATLLIALGVGVLIGHNSNTPAPQRAANPIIIPGGGGASSGGASGSAAANTNNPAQATKPSAAAKASVKHAKTVVVHLTPKVQAKAAAAASHVFGQSGNLTKNVTQQVGAPCSGGAGCQNGKFTGNFFPGG